MLSAPGPLTFMCYLSFNHNCLKCYNISASLIIHRSINHKMLCNRLAQLFLGSILGTPATSHIPKTYELQQWATLKGEEASMPVCLSMAQFQIGPYPLPIHYQVSLQVKLPSSKEGRGWKKCEGLATCPGYTPPFAQ